MKGNFVNLNEIITFRGGGTPRKDVPEYWSDEVPWATVKDFKSLDLSRTQDSISRKGLEASASNLIPAGHVIIPTRMALGKAAINSIDMAINQDLRALIPKVSLDSRYLLHSMIGLADEIVRYGSGATVKGITQENLGKLQIPLPPLAEQKRIAAILDAADALRAKRREALAQLDALLQSTFLTLFGDPVSNPMGWETVKIGDLVTVCRTWNPQKSSNDYFDYIDLSSIDKDAKSIKEIERYSTNEAPSRARQIVESGDVLVATVRPNLNGVAMVREQHHGMTASTGYCVLRPDLKKVAPAFLFQWVTTKVFIQKMIDVASGANYPAVSDAKVKASVIPLPPLPLQQKFAAIVESIQRQKTTQRAHLAELDALFASLQHRAFRGEI